MFDEYFRRYKEINTSSYIRVQFVSFPEDEKKVKMYMIYDGQRFPLIIEGENSMIVLYKLGNNKVLDKYTINYIYNKIIEYLS